MIKTTGNLIQMAEEGYFDYIVHGANCFNTMKSGIAGQLVRKYPQVEQADNSTVKGDRNKLGTYTQALVENKYGSFFTVVNAYTQYNLSRFTGDDVFEYEKFETFLQSFQELLRIRFSHEKVPARVGFPYIGCGLAQGDTERIVSSIRGFSQSCGPIAQVFLVRYQK